jgi:phosphate transport system permease protein
VSRPVPALELDEKDYSDLFPEGEDLQRQIGGRRRREGWARILFLLVLLLTILALATLLYTIINGAFGMTAIVNAVEPEEIVESLGYDPTQVGLADLSKEELVEVLAGSVTNNVGRRLERDQRFFEDRLVFESDQVWTEICSSGEPPAGCTLPPRDHPNVLQLVNERVVVPDVVQTWYLVESIRDRAGIEAEIASAEFQAQYPGAQPEFRAWLNWQFVTSPQSDVPELAGVRTAILGSLWLMAITVAFAFPVGVAAAIYLEEFAKPNRVNRLIQTNINNLAGVPSIIYGMLGLAILVRALEPLTSGSLLLGEGGGVSENGRTILAAGLTLGLLILPVMIISSQEALRAVPNSLRAAGLALGATKWQTIRKHILPVAMPGILTGSILALARALGETAPLVVVGASTFITVDPSGPFSKFTALPIQIYQWTARPQQEFQNIAAAAILVLLVLLLTLNATAVILRNRYSRSKM